MTTITPELIHTDSKRARDGRTITHPDRRAHLINAYRSSGLTMAQFAQREGINRHTLAKWVYLADQAARQQLQAGRPAPQFAELSLPAPTPWVFELSLPNGWVIRAADASALAALLTATQG